MVVKRWKPFRKYLKTSSGELPAQISILDLIRFLDLPSEQLERKPRKGDDFGKAEGLQLY